MTDGTASTSVESTTQATENALRDVQFEEFKRLEARIRALPSEGLVTMNLDGPLAVAVAFAAMPRIAGLHDAMKGLGTAIDLALVDETTAFGNAFLYANADFVALSSPAESLADLLVEGTQLRELLLANHLVLERHGLVKGKFLEELKGANGYRNLSHDLSALAQFYRERWPSIGGKTPLTFDDVTRASVLASALFSGSATKQGTPKEIADSALLRQQAFTLFARAYDETRRAVAFLRWREGDADEIAPSIYTARGGRRKQEPPTATDGATAQLPAAPALPTPTGTDHPSVPVGHMGGSPFKS